MPAYISNCISISSDGIKSVGGDISLQALALNEHACHVFSPAYCTYSRSNILICKLLLLVCFFAFIEGRRKSEAPLGNHDPRTAVQLRTALKRLKEIMEGKSQVLISSELSGKFSIQMSQSWLTKESMIQMWMESTTEYNSVVLLLLQLDVRDVNHVFMFQDSDLKQYWMPDSQCKECYDCNEKFTTFRRRHHCRLCGQIFCSRCCNQEIPGKFMGYTGECCWGVRFGERGSRSDRWFVDVASLKRLSTRRQAAMSD